MVKKIKVDQLKPGMYVHDLNCSWLDHPFFGSSLKVKDNNVIEKIIKFGIRELYIDTDKGRDVEGVPSKEEADKEEKVKLKKHDRHEEHDETDEIHFEKVKPAPVEIEIIKAKMIKKESMLTVQKVMSDIKSGNQIQKESVAHTVDDILASILRNKNALTGLGRLRKADEYLYSHSINVCTLMVAFGKYLGFDSQLLREVGVGALLHDIGAINVPTDILTKEGELSAEEFNIIKGHVQYGRSILEKTEGITETSIITAYQHHERADGSGYPNGLKGDKISYTGQAIAIIDVYDALTTKRCYRRKIAPTQALRMIYEWSDTQFNKELVQKFIRCMGIYPVGSLVCLESGLIGVVTSHSEDNMLQPVIRVIYNKTNKRYISVPYDIDLSKPGKKGEGERITGYEFQEDLNIQPEMYL
ncbi:MAG: HD-GYP domain-containing protein [Nitrospirae bacterium]|nr:HD-GYP domain-containing protein [Nitrospirota bacterium]